MLTTEQYNHFQAFGFIILRQLFTPDELAALDDEFERGLDAAFPDEPFDGTKHQGTILTGPDTPLFATLPEDPRLYEVAEQLYGEDCFPIASDANRYVGDTHWHPDHFIDVKKDTYGVKFAHYLDPVDAETGALRVVPGSHRDPLYTNLEERIGAKSEKFARSRVMSANPDRGTSSPSICASGTPAAAAPPAGECAPSATTSIRTRRMKSRE